MTGIRGCLAELFQERDIIGLIVHDAGLPTVDMSGRPEVVWHRVLLASINYKSPDGQEINIPCSGESL